MNNPNQSAQAIAETLIESLPWLKQYNQQTVVVKYGGNAMKSAELQADFAKDVAFLHYAGVRLVVVHGGGPQITQMLDKLGIESTFHQGYRITSLEAMKVVRMVLTGQVNPELVSAINRHGPIAIGISGEDGSIFAARKRQVKTSTGTVDLGQVGDIVQVTPAAVLEQLDSGRVPVISSIAPDIDHPGECLNVNADAVASALAIALKAKKLVLLTDVPGLYRDWPDQDSLISRISTRDLEQILPTLDSGMIPKMQACFTAVEQGVQKAAIIDGRVSHSVLVELFTNKGIGTEVYQD